MLSNSRVRGLAVGLGLIVLAGVYTQLVLPGPKGAGGRGTPLAVIFEFVLLGMLSGLVACAIVLVYRVQSFINFAASGLGAVGAIFTVYLIKLTPTPFFLAVPLGLAVGALVGAVFELIFIRRFFTAPRLTLTVMSVIATGALAGVVIDSVIKLPFFPRNATIDPVTLTSPLGPQLPFPGFHFHVGSFELRFGFGAVFALWTVALMLAGLGYFFRFTRSGTAMRALSENPDRAELLGISTRKLSTIAWIIVGFLGAATSIASAFLDVRPTTSTAVGAADLLLIPLVAAVIARMRNFTVALITATVLTVLSGAATFSYPGSDSAVTAVFFVLLCAGLFVQRRSLLRSEAQTAGGWESADEMRPVPKELASVPTVRRARLALVAAAVLVAGLLPFFVTPRLASLAGSALLYGIVALSLVVLTGWAGQISLGQGALMAVGALVGGSLITKVGLPFVVAVPATAIVTAAVALVIGIPALRIKGLFLAAVTFAFAVAVNQFLFDPRYVKWLQPTSVPRPRLFVLDFNDQRSMYYLCLAGLMIAVVIVLNLRRSRFGRVLIAMRDNEPALQAVGVPVIRTKLTAFAVSGALAGFAGVLFAVQQRAVAAGDFTSNQSLQIFAFTILGGVTSIIGAILGQVAQFSLLHVASGNVLARFVFNFLPLFILYLVPSGFIGIIESIRNAYLRVVAQRRQIVVPSLFADYDTEALERRLIPIAPLDGGATPVPDGTTYRRRSSLYEVPEPVLVASSPPRDQLWTGDPT